MGADREETHRESRMTADSGETIRRLAAMTDAGAFERLATAVLRIHSRDYHALSHPGVNADGKTVVAPVDGIAVVPGSDPPHLVTAQHTTCARKDLPGKWLGQPESDLPKTAEIVAAERVRTPNARATLALTTNREPPQSLMRDVAAEGISHDIVVDVWSASRLAHVLDHTADGQWVRQHYLGLAQQRLSGNLLRDLSERCVREYPHLFDDPALWVARSLDGNLRAAMEDARDVLFLVAGSGLGKSSACYRLLRRHVEKGGFGLVVPHDVVLEASSPDSAAEIVLRRLCRSLEPGCGAAAFALGTTDAPLLLIIEDVNKAPQPLLVIERLAGWASAGRRDAGPAEGGAARAPWRLVCPVWPQVLSGLRDDARRGVEALSLHAGPLTAEEGRAAVRHRAAKAGIVLSDLQAGAISDALGNDPLLIALHDPAASEADTAPHCVVETFVTKSLERLAGQPTSTATASDLRHAMRRLADGMLRNRSLAPTWAEVRSWFSGDGEAIAALKAVAKARDLFRLEPLGAMERLAFRHDRVRDWLLADGIAALMEKDRLPPDMLAEPFWAEVIGAALVLAPDLPDVWAERVRAANPLALFHAFRQIAEPAAALHHAVIAAIRAWLADPATHGPAHRHLLWEAQRALAETDTPLVLEFAERFQGRSWALLEARFRNGDLLAGVEYCRSFDPGLTFSRRDHLIEHAMKVHGTALLRHLDALLRQPALDERTRQGALHLAGFIGEPGLTDALVTCWTQTGQPPPDLDAFLWASARCAPAEDPGRLLTSVCDAWAALSDVPEKGGSTPRNSLAAYGVKWAFWRGLPDAAIHHFIGRAVQDDLRWPISYMLHGMDHPDAVEFIARELAETARRNEGQGGFSSFAMTVHRHWAPSEEYSSRMSGASRKRLQGLWIDGDDMHLRRAAFKMWAAGVAGDDLSLLRTLPDSHPLANDVLVARLRAADQEAVPALVRKLRDAEHRSYWWQFTRKFWNEDLTVALDAELQRRSASVSREWGAEFDTDWMIPELMIRMSDAAAEERLLRHWDHLRFNCQFIAVALYTATERTKGLAAEALQECPDPQNMLRFLYMDYGINTRDHPGVTERRRIDSLLPYLDHLGDSNLHSLWELCNKRGWVEWRRQHLDARLPQEYRTRRGLADEDLCAELDEFAASDHPAWIDRWLEGFTERHDLPERAMTVLGAWLRARRSLPALRVAAQAVAIGGQRRDLAVLEVDGIEPADEAAAIRADTSYAVHRRTLT